MRCPRRQSSPVFGGSASSSGDATASSSGGAKSSAAKLSGVRRQRLIVRGRDGLGGSILPSGGAKSSAAKLSGVRRRRLIVRGRDGLGGKSLWRSAAAPRRQGVAKSSAAKLSGVRRQRLIVRGRDGSGFAPVVGRSCSCPAGRLVGSAKHIGGWGQMVPIPVTEAFLLSVRLWARGVGLKRIPGGSPTWKFPLGQGRGPEAVPSFGQLGLVPLAAAFSCDAVQSRFALAQ